MKCLYHANCNDGAGAALAVWSANGDEGNDYIPVQYGAAPPDGLEGNDIVMVDFSYPKETIRQLAAIANSILIIDHHKTAQSELADVDDGNGCPITTIFDMEKSGAVLAWEHFHPGTPIPQLLLHVQDRDLYHLKLSGTQDIAKGLQLYPDWREWSQFIGDGFNSSIASVELQGFAINHYLENQSDKILKTEPVLWDITGDTVPLYNLPGFMLSDTLKMALDKYPEAPYAVGYFDMPGLRTYSLRSRQGQDVDVSEIAAPLGGGGHKHAAGFTVKLVDDFVPADAVADNQES